MLSKYLVSLIAAAFVTLPLPVSALSMGVGPKGGINLGGADVDDVKNQERRLGLALGVATEFGVTSPFSVVLEPQYLQRGARFDVLGIEAEADLDYLEIPLLLKAKFGRTEGHAYVFAGPSLGIKLSSEGRYAGFEDGFEDQAASTTFAGDVGVGGAFQLQKSVYLSGDVRYIHGFTDALEESIGAIDSWYSRDVLLMVGILFHFTE